MMKIIFFPNGNTAAFKDGRQVPELQEGWFYLFISMLASLGIDPTKIEFVMPDVSKAKVFETESGGLNWDIIPSH